MLAVVHSAAVLGVDAYPVTIEIDMSTGLPGFYLVGLPDSAVKESRERVFSALRNSGFQIPSLKITVNLAPADIRKEGSSFDLPIAVGMLLASEQITCPDETISKGPMLLLGELALNGDIRPSRGILPVAIYCKSHGYSKLILPEGNIAEAAAVSGVDHYPVRNLQQAIAVLLGDAIPCNHLRTQNCTLNSSSANYSEVKGQKLAKRALVLAAAGAHNTLFVGSPGCGKSMLARRLPGILPPFSEEEQLETSKIYSIAGLCPEGLVESRPFRAPHHTVSSNALVGGGSMPRPGEISLAHNGVLFLDECTEFKKNVLDSLRQPLEDGEVLISRTALRLTFPSRFMLLCAMNPCACGNLMNSRKTCYCSLQDILKYRKRLSGPLLDRIDIQLLIPSLSSEEWSRGATANIQEMSSEVMAAQVLEARDHQAFRFKGSPGIRYNSQLSSNELSKYCKLPHAGWLLLRDVMDKLALSARACDRVLKMSRTIADLAGADEISEEHLAEAVSYRSLDRSPVTDERRLTPEVSAPQPLSLW